MAFGAPIRPEQLAALESVRDQILELNLPHANITDAELTQIGKLSTLTTLRLPRNDVTDGGINALGSLSDLQVLDLHENPRVGDSGLGTISKFKGLKRVYLWHTGVTTAGSSAFMREHPDVVVDLGDSAPLEAKQTTTSRLLKKAVF
jgi:hypothetical protein